MDDEIKKKLKYLRLPDLEENWDQLLAESDELNISSPAFLNHIVDRLYGARQLRAKSSRLIAARIPDQWIIATYPFIKQPKLNKRKILTIHDSLDYMTKKQNILLIGPTGVGKTGLGTSFLVNAIISGYRGRFISFPELIDDLNKSNAAHKEDRVLRKYAAIDCLMIDELGYVDIDAAQVGLFFRLMSMRHRTKATIISTNLGFQDWGEFLKNQQLTAALLDRLTENAHVLNMRSCISIRSKPAYTDGTVSADD